jgi:S-adenosylmethionine synthetase
LLPDGKIQVTIENEILKNIVISYQAEDNQDEYVKEVIKEIIGKTSNNNFDECDINLIHFKLGGFKADTGLTGRKLITYYGPRVPIGGGNFSGKDGTKVDRSGAYLARNIAIKNLKETGCNECFVRMAYVIGKNNPLYLYIEPKETNKDYKYLESSVSEAIKKFDLKKPIYKESSLNGHFGYPNCPWEI